MGVVNHVFPVVPFRDPSMHLIWEYKRVYIYGSIATSNTLSNHSHSVGARLTPQTPFVQDEIAYVVRPCFSNVIHSARDRQSSQVTTSYCPSWRSLSTKRNYWRGHHKDRLVGG